jgi:hypothetical protein
MLPRTYTTVKTRLTTRTRIGSLRMVNAFDGDVEEARQLFHNPCPITFRLTGQSASEDGTKIAVYSRTGGSNREDYPNLTMRKLSAWKGYPMSIRSIR